MLNGRLAKIAVVNMVLSAMSCAVAFAQSEDPGWIIDLKSELAKNYECKVSEVLSMHEGKLGDRNMYTARVKCADGRLYDANKLDPDESFKISRCEQLLC